MTVLWLKNRYFVMLSGAFSASSNTMHVVTIKTIESAFAERVLAQLHKQDLLSDEDVVQILSEDLTGFGVPVPLNTDSRAF